MRNGAVVVFFSEANVPAYVCKRSLADCVLANNVTVQTVASASAWLNWTFCTLAVPREYYQVNRAPAHMVTDDTCSPEHET